MSRQKHSALLIAGLATLSLLLTLAACSSDATPRHNPKAPAMFPPDFEVLLPTPAPTSTPTAPLPTPKSLPTVIPVPDETDIPLPHEPCSPPHSDRFDPFNMGLHYHAGISPPEHPYFHGYAFTLYGGPPDEVFHYERYEHFVGWTQDASHVVFDIDDVIWTVNVESAELNEIADADSDYMRLDGSNTYHQRMAYGFYGDVSPDGSHIVYSTCEYPLPGSFGGYGYELGITGVDGTGKRRLTDNTYFEHYPVWSPDGSKVAFLRNGGSNDYQDRAQLSIMTVDTASASPAAAVGQKQGGSEGDMVTCQDTDRVAMIPPAWSPDGGHIAFAVHEGMVRPYDDGNYPKSYAFVLYTIGSDCSGLRRIGVTTTPPVWSPDGRHLAYGETSNYSLKIHIVDGDGRHPRILWRAEHETRYRFYPSGGDWPARIISQLSWSPDGTEILFVSDGVHTVHTDTGQLRTLVKGFMRSTRAAWSPDGLRVAIHHPGYQILTVTLDEPHARFSMELPVDATSCSNGQAIYTSPESSTLVEDCVALLGIRNLLTEYGIFLPWSTATHMYSWPGVRVCAGSAYRSPGAFNFVCGLSLQGNGLTGSISSRLMDHLINLSQLEELNLGNNKLEGKIPPEFGRMETLRFLSLHNNRLEGEIPPELGDMPLLMVLNLSDNRLEGEIPPELGNPPILGYILLSNNRIEGEFPPELGNLEFPQLLDFTGSNLSGCVPSELRGRVLGAGLEYCATGEADNS